MQMRNVIELSKAALLACLLALNGCALFQPNIGQYTASTEADYVTEGDNVKSVHFKSNKDYEKFHAKFNPQTKQFEISADKAGTSTDALAALAQAQKMMAEAFQTLSIMMKDLMTKMAPVAATAGS